MASKKMVDIPGSKKKPFRKAHVIAPAPADERLEVTVRVRPKNPMPNREDMLKLSGGPLPQLTHEQYERRYGSDAKDMALVKKFATEHNLAVVRESAARRTVILSGTVVHFNRAFGVRLKSYAYSGGTYRGRTGFIKIPASLSSIVEGVFGLDNRPVAQRSARFRAIAPVAGQFTGAEMAKIYNFPKGFDGTGQTIGIIELGGGYRPADMKTYFSSIGLTTPKIIPVSVDGGTNSPSTPESPDGEVVLDLQVAGAAAPGAKFVVYFAPNLDSHVFLDALTKAIHDTENNPSVISISWDFMEDVLTTSFQTQFDSALQAAALLGITVCVASGDNGAAGFGPTAWDGEAHVDFPSTCPFALSCGGTRLIEKNGAIKTESVWNQNKADPNAGPDGSFGSAGGGVSKVFPLPGYQELSNVPRPLNRKNFKGRGVPDVTGNGARDTRYKIFIDGKALSAFGTSAVAPLWAALIARINQKLKGRVGFINPQIYAIPPASGAFHDISLGNNRVSFGNFKKVGYDAAPGWDPASGLGSPDGTVLAGLLKVSTSGTPAAKRASRKKAGRSSPRRKAK